MAAVRTMHRHYRVAALPLAQAPRSLPAVDAAGMAEAAERDLRARLAAGERPEVAPVAPERCVLSDVGRDGRLTGPCWAWSRASEPMSHSWVHSPHVVGVLETDLWAKDPMSPVYAAAGSVQVQSGRLLNLIIAPWLEPVADQLRARYGANLTVDGADLPSPEVPSAAPLVVRDYLDPQAVRTVYEASLRSYRRGHMLPATAGGPTMITLPPNVAANAGPLVQKVAERFGLPSTNGHTAAALYAPGEGFQTSTAARPDAPSTLDRTVVFSVLLTAPGEQFHGGDLYVNDEHVPMAAGDLVAFTAATPHRIEPVTDGHRVAWLGFGEVVR
jgi:hypothetical protein